MPRLIGTECLKVDGNNTNSPSTMGNKKVSELTWLYFSGLNLNESCIALLNCMGGNVLDCLK